ncbi:TM2 domain-containing protein [Calycomorphotria hydatis]|uniref:TM2 domain protein n=1 Tax=Calycomorphotria hydatis TaxID=2528027 RepID=A0A517T443_9PLAN|nr:TM2 domain-containing protein [Calycomorphotria hydatis]QDT63129.1 TM2 domain protein [Calycomorphotria hydatis]
MESENYSEQPPPRTSYPGSDKKLAAGLVAILLPGLGIHKFILEMPNPGVIMLLGTIACTILSPCLIFPIFGTLVLSAISVVEGILYLTKSDEEFYERYIVKKTEWF